jgi:hypothetical protein
MLASDRSEIGPLPAIILGPSRIASSGPDFVALNSFLVAKAASVTTSSRYCCFARVNPPENSDKESLIRKKRPDLGNTPKCSSPQTPEWSDA